MLLQHYLEENPDQIRLIRESGRGYTIGEGAGVCVRRGEVDAKWGVMFYRGGRGVGIRRAGGFPPRPLVGNVNRSMRESGGRGAHRLRSGPLLLGCFFRISKFERVGCGG
jgi:hypothetical protein